MKNKTKGQPKDFIRESIEVKEKMLKDKKFLAGIEKMADLISVAIKNKKKILIFGNGGSSADAQHFAAELINKFKLETPAFPAISLGADPSVISSISNDLGYEQVFSRQIEGLGEAGDIAIAITTSDVEAKKGGHSANIAYGLIAARKKGLLTIGLCSSKSKEVLNLTDLSVKIPSKNTPRIQEAHITVIHSVCELVENKFFIA
ncbi:MAG: SIS domain-containing protein [Candidatus Azambacteria bacterium]|nr:SIS domain-containing protein [Candidatus Azambacteria bacterium]